jgi:predicted TIM-barrel fold metal-dependent hydrolase
MMLDAPLAPTLEADDKVAPAAHVRLGIIDGDVHPAPRSVADFKPYLSSRWWEYLQTYGARRRSGMSHEPYPKSAPRACRRDAWPEEGGAPGSSLTLMQEQYLDAYGIEFGILGPLGLTGQSELNLDLSAAITSAVNDWQRETFTRPEPRLKSSIVVPYEDAAASVREIDKRAPDPAYAQVFMLTRSAEPAGNRRYWPIYEAAEHYGLPVGMHVFGSSGHPYTGTGWPSYYIEESSGHSTSCQTVVTSLVIEGVFERFPRLKVVIIEGGFGWLPALAWRLDRLHERMRSEVPHLKRRPSEYIREHIWLTTQPMEEPQDRKHVLDVMEWIGWDRLLFASDYPHWDFDDPFRALPAGMPRDRAKQIWSENARSVYRLAQGRDTL